MTKRAFEKIRAGLEEVLAYARGDKSRGTMAQVRVSKGRIVIIRDGEPPLIRPMQTKPKQQP